MQAYSVNDAHPMFSMRDQVTMALAAALGHVWNLIEAVPQPEERLETIYAWVEDWDKTWASIHSWWKYVNDNGISMLKVRDECMRDYTEESAMCQSLLVLGAIAIADLRRPVEQRWIHIDDIFADYQERVELRAQLEAERLTREPSMHTRRQAAMTIGEGQGCAPSDTEAGKGKGKEKATDEVDELENDEGEHLPNPDPSKTGAPAPDANLRCRECTKANAECEGLPGESCKQCRQAKWKCSQSLRVGRKCKNTGSGETAAGLSHKQTNNDWAETPDPCLQTTPQAKLQTDSQAPNTSSTPAPRPHPELTLPPMDNLGDLGDGGLFGRPMGLLDDPPMPVNSAQDKPEDPPVAETLPVANMSKSTTHEALAERIQLLEGRVDDEEFELTQIHQMLGLLVMQVERQIGAVQG
ncbi:hypothetical protein M404DRAFT_29937 [Pisolithus tinctorius Marx 270]|uniref:Uncharacterized protein n=1 Tax=Pisolithus tinctorius Marx 270 TaxID=870435 RepID=A0A0C3NXM7_PISTI|nr:hypothetical protein M404DRAFT_29937 [Pisolithus tinctorius Marx 270]